MTTLTVIAPLLARSRAAAPLCGPGRQAPVVRLVCTLGSVGARVTSMPGLLARVAAHDAWPAIPLILVAVLGAVTAWRAAGAAAARRQVEGGWQARVIPPRTLDASQAGQVWDLLGMLARRAAHGWRAATPIVFEIHARDGELTAGLWLPACVPVQMVADVATQAWPGARVERAGLPGLSASDGQVAACRLAAAVPEGRWLVQPELLAAGASRRGGEGPSRCAAY